VPSEHLDPYNPTYYRKETHEREDIEGERHRLRYDREDSLDSPEESQAAQTSMIKGHPPKDPPNAYAHWYVLASPAQKPQHPTGPERR
jgi:hypothetical protein